MRNRIRAWYSQLSNQWKATLRSAYQGAVAAVGAFILAVFVEAIGLLNGGDWSESLDNMSNAGRVLGVAVIGILTGLVTAFMNRKGQGPTYPPPPPPPA